MPKPKESRAVVPATPELGAAERAIALGDLSKLNPDERMAYYHAVCQSIGLNPLTRPFDYLTLNGRLILYARKDACDQLRKLYGVSLEVLSQQTVEDVYLVHVRARIGDRADEDDGAVNVAGLKGDAKANAIMKAITKAKRRVTLSICGLGFLDETEVETVGPWTVERPGERPAPPALTIQPDAPAPPPNGKAHPKDGREFLSRLQAKDADLAAEGLCSPGALLAVVGRRGREQKIDAKLSDWQPDSFPVAFAAVKEFESEARKALKPLAQRIDDLERPLVEAGACEQDDLTRHVAAAIGADFSEPESWPTSAGAKAFRAAREFIAEARKIRVEGLLAAKGREWADACKMCGVDCDADVAQLPDHEFGAAVTILSALPDAKGRDAGSKKKQLQGAS